MAKDIDSIERSVLTPTQSVSSGNAFDKLGDASSGLAQMISNKASELAVDEAGKQAQRDVEAGETPKKLAPPLNKATKAYNDAVSDTEARHLVIGAKEQIRESFANATNPANFTAETPALFRAELQGIVEGTLENTRETNRGKVNLALEQMAADASIDMLKHSIEFDTKQTIKTMTTEVEQMIKDRRNAVISGDDKRVAELDSALSLTLEDYGNQSAAIKRMLPDIKKKLAQNADVDKVLGGYAHSASEKKQAQFMSDFAQNKDNLSYETWTKASKELLALDATEQHLNFQTRSIANQTVINGIDNGTITTPEDISQFPDLTAVDQLRLANHLEKHKQAEAKSRYNLVEAQKNIIQGNPGLNTDAQKNAMFANARQEFEKQTGRPMGLIDMYESINGTSAFPASGVPGVSMGANVPQFDGQLTNMLTSRDPTQTTQASMVYNDAVNVKKQPNLINISGDALDVASLYSSQNLGAIDQTDLAKDVSDTVLDSKDPQIQERSNRFNKEFSSQPKVMSKLFKQTFNTSFTTGVNDQAMGVFKEIFRKRYLKSGSADAALEATKYEMRQWCTSKYFEAGMVGQPCPEKELSITSMGHAFDNQLSINTQLLIDKNKEDRKDNENFPFKIEWINPDAQAINTNDLTDDDRVFKDLRRKSFSNISLGETIAKSPKEPELKSVLRFLQSIFPSPKPQVKINGQKTELFLMPTHESRLGEGVRYALFYHDRFGMAQPVPDDTSPSGNAMFSPVGLDRWAPSVMEDQNQQQVKDAALRFQRKQAESEWEALSPESALGQLFDQKNIGLLSRGILGDVFESSSTVGTDEQRAEIFRRMRSGDASEIEAIIRQRVQGTNAATAPAEALKADNTGIDASQTSTAFNVVAPRPSDAQQAKPEQETSPTEKTKSNSIVNSVVKDLPRVEGEGSDIAGDVETGSQGLTQAALDDLGIKKKLSELTKTEHRKYHREFLDKNFDRLTRNLDNYDDAPREVKKSILEAVDNIGAAGVMSRVKKFAANQDWVGAMKKLLEVSTSQGKTLLGLAKRRAQEYNMVASLYDAELIKSVEQKRKSLVFLGKDGKEIFKIIKPRHPDSKIHRIPVPNSGGK